jgi:hypothetical protein
VVSKHTQECCIEFATLTIDTLDHEDSKRVRRHATRDLNVSANGGEREIADISPFTISRDLRLGLVLLELV